MGMYQHSSATPLYIYIEGKPVLNLEEAAIFLGIAKSSLYKMPHEHIVPFCRPNGKIIL